MKFARTALIFSIGLFAIVSQALLFREFLVSFEGNELGIGAFFGSWFVWIGIGALLIYHSEKLAHFLSRHIDLFSLLYLPAFLVQYMLILSARDLVGIDPYQLFGFGSMIAAAFLVNAPLSILTGILFPVACRWVEKQGDLPVSRVYLIESAGSFIGGLLVTILLATGINSPTVFLTEAMLLSLAVLSVRIARKRRRLFAASLVALIAVLLAAGTGLTWKHHIGRTKWHKLLGEAQFAGVFQTAQAEYLYGKYQDAFLITCHGQVCETFPNPEAAGAIAALHLCQQPKSQRILIAGSDLAALSRQFLKLKQTRQITLYSPDPEYIDKLKSLLGQAAFLADPRVHFLHHDIRAHLRSQGKHYDLIILNFPEAAAAVLNRFRTVEFYHTVKAALTDSGLVGVSIPGGENVMGTELIELGASSLHTLKQVFSHIAIKPGEQTWFLAGHTDELSEQPGTLKDRFARIDGAEKIYPPAGILSLYLPRRIAFARQMYQSPDLPEKLLLNHDDRPLAHLYGLLLLGKHSNSILTRFVKRISLCGIGFFLLPIIILLILRLVYVYKTRPNLYQSPPAPSTFNSRFLIFSGGLVGISTEITLMYLLQSRYGTLYLHVGLIASLFMLGLVLGAALARRVVRLPNWSWLRFVPATTLMHIFLLVAASQLGSYWNYPLFIAAFILCGLMAGLYFPFAAKALETAGARAQQAGASLELTDHVSAAVGGFLTGVVLIPILGTSQTLLVSAVLITVNVLFAFIPAKHSLTQKVSAPFFLRKLGYICFGIALCIIIDSHLAARAAGILRPTLTKSQAGVLAPVETLHKKELKLPQTGRIFTYFDVVDENQELKGHIFSSRPLAGNIRGYGGTIDLITQIDTQGRLINFHIASSNETPSYLKLLKNWYKTLQNRNLFDPDALANVKAVTGATISCQAIPAILEHSSQRVAEDALGRNIAAARGGSSKTISEFQ